MAALLGAHADHVWSVEIDAGIAAQARENLRHAGVTKRDRRCRRRPDRSSGTCPYDAIMVSGAVRKVPQVLLDQLKAGRTVVFAIEGSAPGDGGRRASPRVGDEVRRVAVFETVADPLRRHRSRRLRFEPMRQISTFQLRDWRPTTGAPSRAARRTRALGSSRPAASPAHSMPMRGIRRAFAELKRDADIVMICHHGARAASRPACSSNADGIYRRDQPARGGVAAWAHARRSRHAHLPKS